MKRVDQASALGASRTRRVRCNGISVLTALLLAAMPALAQNGAAEAARESVTIWSDGLPLAGDLWRPATSSAGASHPALLMLHGWGGVKQHLNDVYAPQFAAAGFVVLTFDYRGWGESPGRLLRIDDEITEVREVVDPIAFLEDIRNALAFLIGEPDVDRDRLAVWGTSLGGGLALHTAAEFPDVGALLIQVGSVNPLAEAAQSERHPLAPRNLMQRRMRVARGELPPFPGPESAIPSLRGSPDWVRYGQFDPFSRKGDVRAATLIIDVEDEELFDIRQNGAALYAALQGQVPVRYEVLPGSHYAIYTGDPLRQAVAWQIEWLEQHVGTDAPDERP